MLTINILYTEDNADWQTVADMTRRALQELSIEATINYRAVRSDREAFDLKFIGSPTVLIDGVDPWPMPSAPAGLRLRPYFTEEGMADTPTYEMLVEALREYAGSNEAP